MKNLPAGMQRWSTKHGSENCGVGKTLCHWSLQPDAQCPRCGADEDTTHVLQCLDIDATATWNAHLLELVSLLTDLHTPFELHSALIDRLNAWRQQQPLEDNTGWSPSLRTLIHSQDLIGWKCFLEGLPSSHFATYMDTYYSTNGYSYSGSSWTYKTLRKTHLMAWSLWDHRNRVPHDEKRPRQKQALSLLHDAISNEYLTGLTGLPQSQHYFFRHSLLQLLRRPTHFKQSWLQNLHAARDREARRNLIITEERTSSALYQWMKTGRLCRLPPPT